MKNNIEHNIEIINEKIQEASESCGRKANEIKLMAVTKTLPIDKIESAYNCGLRLFGENRILEAKEKFSNFHKDINLQLIGHLQSNKAKHATELFSTIQSIDKFKTAKEVNKYCQTFDKRMKILIEVNTSGEATKNGLTNYSDLFNLIDQILELKYIDIDGLMTIAPFTKNEIQIRKSFSDLRDLYEKVNTKYSEFNLSELSMGMSSDFEYAIKEGSSLVRIGSAIFGKRI